MKIKRLPTSFVFPARPVLAFNPPLRHQIGLRKSNTTTTELSEKSRPVGLDRMAASGGDSGRRGAGPHERAGDISAAGVLSARPLTHSLRNGFSLARSTSVERVQ
jgi:hypothetical protein